MEMETTNNGPGAKLVREANGKDGLLQQLVNLTNASKTSRLSITLQMKGVLVSGTLVPADVYFEKFAYQVVASASQDEEVFGPHFLGLGAPYEAARAKADPAILDTDFLHLDNCKVTSSGLSDATPGMLWRGRIAEVDGFYLGVLEVTRTKKQAGLL